MSHASNIYDARNCARDRAASNGLRPSYRRLMAKGFRLLLILGMLQITALNDHAIAQGAVLFSIPPEESVRSEAPSLEKTGMMAHPEPAFGLPPAFLDPVDQPEGEDVLIAGGSEKGIAIVSGGQVVQILSHSDEVKVIVRLRGDPVAVQLNRLKGMGQMSQSQLAADIRSYAANLERNHDESIAGLRDTGLIGVVTRRFSYLVNGFAATVRLGDIPRIKQWDDVEAVYPDEQLQITLDGSVPLVGAPSVWQMSDGAGNPVTGQGITVAIIDTGVDYTHADLGGCLGQGCRVIGGYDFVNEDADPMDDHGHGTHVAGIVAANGKIRGVAPGANILSYKACNLYGGCSQSNVIAALERAADPDGNPLTDDAPAVINMSLGGAGTANDPLAQATDRAVEQGIVVVVAAGNTGDYHTIGSPGAAAQAITVGASTKSDFIANFSSRGPVGRFVIKPDIIAPGYDISSSYLGNSYVSMDGTSMASPHVAGAAALLVQLYPEWSPDRIKAVLMNMAISLGENPYAEGTGRLQVNRAAIANTSVKPATLSMGRVDSSQPVWTANGEIEISNHGQMAQTYLITVASGLPAGVTLKPSAETISLDPGQSATLQMALTVDNAQLPYPSEEPFAYYGKIMVISGFDSISVPFAFIKDIQLTLHFDESPFLVYVHDRGVRNHHEFFAHPDLELEIPLQPAIYDLIVVYDGFSYAEGPYSDFVVREGIDLSKDLRMSINRADAIYKVDARIRLSDGRESPAFAEESYPGVSGIFHRPSDQGMWLFGGQTSLNKTKFSPMSADYYFETNALVKFNSDEHYYDHFYSFEGIQKDTTLINDVRSFKELTFSILPFADIPYVQLWYFMQAPVTQSFWVGTFEILESCASPPIQKLVLRSPQPSAGVIAPHRRIEVYPMQTCSESRTDEEAIGDSPLIRAEDSETFVTYAYNKRIGYITELYRSTSDEFTFNLAPVFWSGVFAVEADRVQIISDLSTAGWSRVFLRDQWQNLLRNGVTYALTKNGEIIQSGELRGESDSVSWTSQPFSAGQIIMDMEYSASMRGIPVQGTVTASFDTRMVDHNPPYIHALRILSHGERSDRIGSGSQVQVEVIDELALKLVYLAIDLGDGQGWQNLAVSKQGDVFSADLPAIPAGAQVGLRITAEDESGNRLVNEISPAFFGGTLIYFPIMMQGAVP